MLLLVIVVLGRKAEAFHQPLSVFRSAFLGRDMQPTTKTMALPACRRTLVKDYVIVDDGAFDPMGFSQHEMFDNENAEYKRTKRDDANDNDMATKSWVALTTALAVPQTAMAAEAPNMDPSSFQPVCPTSDGLYRALQTTTEAVVGAESFREYGPLIAGGLLRVRLEFCVVESFFQEAVGPFVARNGVSWILPLHETVETFLAGVIFAFAATFILLGSTKLVTVAVTYADFLLGVPSRLFGGFFYDRAIGKPVTLDVGFGPFKTRLIGPPDEEEETKVEILQKGPVEILVIGLSGVVKVFGLALGVLREVFDAIDLFVGRYLVIWATGYVLIKFLHYKVFPDFPF